MVIFQLGIKLGALEKKLGREPVTMDISEWEMRIVLNALQNRSKTMYYRITKELINEAKNEGYEIIVESPKIKIKCPNCKEDIEI